MTATVPRGTARGAADSNGGAEVAFDPSGGSVAAVSGFASVDVSGSEPGAVALLAEAAEFGLSSNTVEFDVYSCIGFTGPRPTRGQRRDPPPRPGGAPGVARLDPAFDTSRDGLITRRQEE
jgi:hypothetical protein